MEAGWVDKFSAYITHISRPTRLFWLAFLLGNTHEQGNYEQRQENPSVQAAKTNNV
jgi:hypothetical protein